MDQKYGLDRNNLADDKTPVPPAAGAPINPADKKSAKRVAWRDKTDKTIMIETTTTRTEPAGGTSDLIKNFIIPLQIN